MIELVILDFRETPESKISPHVGVQPGVDCRISGARYLVSNNPTGSQHLLDDPVAAIGTSQMQNTLGTLTLECEVLTSGTLIPLTC